MSKESVDIAIYLRALQRAIIEAHKTMGAQDARKVEAIYRATAYMKKNRDYSIEFLRKFTGEKDAKVSEMEFDIVLSGRPSSAKIERKWLEDSLALARLGGITDLPPIEEIYTDRFSAVRGD